MPTIGKDGTRSEESREEKNGALPSIELSCVAIVAEYRGHAFSSADIANGGRVPSNVIQSVFHRQLRVRFQYFRFRATVIPH